MKKLGDVFVHARHRRRGGRDALGLALDLVVDHDRRSGPSGPTIRRPTCSTKRSGRCSGSHVAQKGSLVDGERLRFDFSHQKPISDAEELAEVEDIANAVVLQNEPVVTRLMGIDDARASGARALFGEKYGDEVRVVSMGRLPDVECVRASRLFDRIVRRHPCGPHRAISGSSASWVRAAVASGVRRIEARTGSVLARHHLNAEAARLRGRWPSF